MRFRRRQRTLPSVDLASQLGALERALTRLGIRVLEEELPDEAQIDGGLCRVADQLVLYVAPGAPPWRRAEVLLDALRRLPHRDIWLPPEIRGLLQRNDFGGKPARLLTWRGKDEH